MAAAGAGGSAGGTPGSELYPSLDGDEWAEFLHTLPTPIDVEMAQVYRAYPDHFRRIDDQTCGLLFFAGPKQAESFSVVFPEGLPLQLYFPDGYPESGPCVITVDENAGLPEEARRELETKIAEQAERTKGRKHARAVLRWLDNNFPMIAEEACLSSHVSDMLELPSSARPHSSSPSADVAVGAGNVTADGEPPSESRDTDESVPLAPSVPSTAGGEAWQCPVCTYLNQGGPVLCAMCDTPRSRAGSPAARRDDCTYESKGDDAGSGHQAQRATTVGGVEVPLRSTVITADALLDISCPTCTFENAQTHPGAFCEVCGSRLPMAGVLEKERLGRMTPEDHLADVEGRMARLEPLIEEMERDVEMLRQNVAPDSDAVHPTDSLRDRFRIGEEWVTAVLLDLDEIELEPGTPARERKRADVRRVKELGRRISMCKSAFGLRVDPDELT